MSTDRCSFLRLLAQTAVASTIAYSLPSIIVPKNIVPVTTWGEASLFLDYDLQIPQSIPLDLRGRLIYPFWKEANGLWVNYQ